MDNINNFNRRVKLKSHFGASAPKEGLYFKSNSKSEPPNPHYTVKTFTESFKITKEKTTTMFGAGVEYFEQNVTYFVENYGIVKDEMEFRFNEPDDFDGFYRLELINCRHCENGSSSRGTFNSPTEINFNEFDLIDDSGDSYKKTRSYGLQKLEFNTQQ